VDLYSYEAVRGETVTLDPEEVQSGGWEDAEAVRYTTGYWWMVMTRCCTLKISGVDACL
jgi:hypothetical protein